MNKILIILFLLVSSITVYSTPERANWRRIIFIGHNETFYYYYQLERIQPGSYYNYTEKLYLIKQFIETDSIVEIINLRETIFQSDPMDTSSSIQYAKTEKIINPINSEKYLISENVNYQFHSMKYNYGKAEKLILNENGLFYKKKTTPFLIISNHIFEEKINEYRRLFDHESSKPRLMAYYRDSTNSFFIIEQGTDCYDTNMIQTIYCIKTDKIEELIKANVK